ncbi:hypothetical protein WEN_01895 [Mycoplasma wenyonii str. Massachusetts]|uniref:Uncharacterized protein n=1 Tax=Mycoplasma wenyonii (strain Massachusetts) TaxID=1197325 RepID=I6ZEY8_MYCWM|nr:hypothetical protein [Mycoplasma wenyonii]AFN65172.1 hypothetical protein WEN_01895 [Mycoplasma wenyonii str. Massachusetts]
MPWKLAHAIKLIPILITGTFTVSPSFLPPPPAQDIGWLLSERKCFIAARDDGKTKQLLACRTYPTGKSLYFYFYDSGDEGRRKGQAIPVKHLKLTAEESSGDDKNIHLDFLWGEQTTFKAKFIFHENWEEDEGIKGRGLDLTSLCEKAGVLSYRKRGEEKKSWLRCVYGGGEKEFWIYEEYKLSSSGSEVAK